MLKKIEVTYKEIKEWTCPHCQKTAVEVHKQLSINNMFTEPIFCNHCGFPLTSDGIDFYFYDMADHKEKKVI
jgi:C4-type Zn-finger protein